MISIESAVKKFDNEIALDSMDLTIDNGTAFGLLGSNGAGKSTLLRLISGIYKPDSGSVKINGEEVYNNVKMKEKVFFINDETVQFNNMTLTELKKFYSSFYSNFSEEKWKKLYDVLKLPLEKRISTFSKGMKRQAVVICGIACQTEYLLLDEAFDGLDPTMRIIVKKMLVDEMLDSQKTIVISSHNLHEIEEFCDSTALVHKGKIVFNRGLDSLKGSVHKVQCAFDRDVNAESFAGLEVLHFDKKGSVLYLIIKGSEEDITGHIIPMNPMFFDILPLSLEEIFIYEMEGQGYDSSKIDLQ